MKILLLAPHPFYQDRGTPIAVDLLLRVFSEHGDCVDVLTYHEGKSLNYVNVTIHRIFSLPFLRDISPGFSFKKLACDFLMLLKGFPLLLKNRYDIVHAVEESVFMAVGIRFLFGIPYIYDMDSSMPQQLMEKHPQLAAVKAIMTFLERFAVNKSEAVVPVCQSLADIAAKHGAKRMVLLPDISLLERGGHLRGSLEIKKRYGIDGLTLMYVGNMEHYQGIDLLLESFTLVFEKIPSIALVLVGGSSLHLRKYKEMSGQLKISDGVFFLGPRPANELGAILDDADILVSPRIQGNNTPMKIYSYLHSGKPVLATDLPTHTQILDDQVALLAPPSPEAFSKGMMALLGDKGLRESLGLAGRKLVQERYSYASFQKKLLGLYEILENDLAACSPVS